MFRIFRGLLFIAHAFIHEMVHVFALLIVREPFVAVVIGRKAVEEDKGLSVVWPWEEGFRRRGRVTQPEGEILVIKAVFIQILPLIIEVVAGVTLGFLLSRHYGPLVGVIGGAILLKFLTSGSKKDAKRFLKGVRDIREELSKK